MKRNGRDSVNMAKGWLLFFYSLPSKPVSGRMKIWRKLAKAGAVQLKGAVYVLPMSDEHYEFFQWLVSEVSSIGGEAAFTRVEVIDSIKDGDIKALFYERQEAAYQALGKTLEDLETKTNSIRKGSRLHSMKTLSEQFDRVSKGFEEVLRTDFFSSKTGSMLRSRIAALNAAIKGLSGSAPETKPVSVSPRRLEDYQKKVWISRKKPFVDRMASAWLIKKFIDRKAVFRLVDEKDLEIAGMGYVTFDVSGGVFTHAGDLCTFEVLVKSFGLKDKAVKKIAELVHELDIKDEKYKPPEAKGLEDVLIGIRKTAKNDKDALERGMQVFEMIYVSKS